jgi:hypothetical protein
MREVETSDIHACIDHFNEHFDFVAGWTKGANDFGSAFGNVD